MDVEIDSTKQYIPPAHGTQHNLFIQVYRDTALSTRLAHCCPQPRRLEQRLDLDRFVDRLREGLTSGHPEMPTFRFSRDDARALVACLRAVQRPSAEGASICDREYYSDPIPFSDLLGVLFLSCPMSAIRRNFPVQ